MKKDNTESVWQKDPEKIRTFLSNRTDYEQLGAEIAYILKKRIEENEIEFSSVSHRAKTLKSFLEKITRKSYTDPFTDITDFSGVRVVFLYQSSFIAIEKIVNKEFKVLEKVDKLNDKGTDKFGYGAIHYIVQLGKRSSGARYDYLKHLKCEIQVRTVLQDAWAIIDHHLVYKNESDIPTTLQRKLNSLAGLFETADNQFENIRQEREKYLSVIHESIKTNDFLKNELNLDTFIEYSKWKFPSLPVQTFDKQAQRIFEDLSQVGFKNIADLDKVIEKYKGQINKIKKDFAKFRNKGEDGILWSGVLTTALLAAIEKDSFRKIAKIKKEEKEILVKYKK